MIALGKHGGAELNYSSDIDLCFVYEAEGETEGPEVVASRTYFARLGERLIGALTAMTEEGTVYRVDLRLRPEGTGGPLALPLDAYRAYHTARGALWERQALIKARVATGDERVGQAFLDLAQEIVYRPGLEREALAEIRAMKNRIDRLLRARGQQERHVKLGVGGIRDVEFHIQALQLLYGAQDPWLRERNSLRALHWLAERGYLSWEESGQLAHAYEFLRRIEHRLQILHAFQTHTLPADPAELGKLARRLGYGGDGETAARQLLLDYDRTRRTVRSRVRGVLRRLRAAGRRGPALGWRESRGGGLRGSRARAAEPPAALGRARAGGGAGRRPRRPPHAHPRHPRRPARGAGPGRGAWTRSSASSRRRGRGRRTSPAWRRRRSSSAASSRSSRGRSGSRRC